MPNVSTQTEKRSRGRPSKGLSRDEIKENMRKRYKENISYYKSYYQLNRERILSRQNQYYKKKKS